MGVGGEALAEWAFVTRTFQRIHDEDGGTTGIDDDFFARRFLNVGAWIFGRTCSDPFEGRRLTIPGRAGGETRRHFAAPCSF